MKRHALQVISDGPGHFRWVILAPTVASNIFEQHSVADREFGSFADALNAGAVALTAVEDAPYANPAADAVGDAEGVIAEVTHS